MKITNYFKKINLQKNFFLLVFLFSVSSIYFSFSENVYGEIFIPKQEYGGYFDTESVYTVVGNVKNQNEFAVIPTITITVIDNGNEIKKSFQHVAIPAMYDIPFKIKIPEIKSENPKLLPAEIQYTITEKDSINLQVIYDRTLVTHEDGHVTGRIQNIGYETVYNPKVYAIVHGYEKYILDVAHNIEKIEKIEPGEIVTFSIYPDPSVTDPVRFYSCFAAVDTTVIPISIPKNDGIFDFRYDAGAWFSAAKFNDDGTELSIRGYNSYPFETFVNFEFTPISGDEKFQVLVDDEPIDFIQSVDEMGQLHVAFNMKPYFQEFVTISGFEEGIPVNISKTPLWMKNNAMWWAENQSSDSEFLEDVNFLFDKGVIFVAGRQIVPESSWEIPQWFKFTAQWWAEDKISEDEFLNAIENLVKREIIKI